MTANAGVKEVVVVTGATGFLGRHLVWDLLSNGEAIFAIGRSSAKFNTIFHDENPLLTFRECDFNDRQSIYQLLSDIARSGIRVRGLVHLAISRETQGNLAAYSETFEHSVATNASSTFYLWDAFSRHMASRGGGSLVLMSSIYGARAPEFTIYENTTLGTEPDYAYVKSGGMALVRYYASLLGSKNVRSNAVVLGGVANGQPKEFVERYSARTCLGRMARPSEVVGICKFLLSDDSSYITGAEIPVDGGLLCK